MSLLISLSTVIFGEDVIPPLPDPGILENVPSDFTRWVKYNHTLDAQKIARIQVASSKDKVVVNVNGGVVYDDKSVTTGRGLHVIILSATTTS